MTILPVLEWPDPRLSQVCAKVDDPSSLRHLVQDMFDTMYNAPGRGLAAPQIGVMARVFVMDPTWKDGEKSPYMCINPEIIEASGLDVTNTEACLSFPGVSADVARPAEITLAYSDLTGKRIEEQLSGFSAMCAQHELDHLNGVVIFDRLEPDARKKALEEYAESQ